MRKVLSLLLMLLPLLSWGQVTGAAYNDVVMSPKRTGTPFVGTPATVRICTAAATGVPCTPLATIGTGFGSYTGGANPFPTDSSGYFTVFAAPGNYKAQISGIGIATKTYSFTVSSSMGFPLQASVIMGWSDLGISRVGALQGAVGNGVTAGDDSASLKMTDLYLNRHGTGSANSDLWGIQIRNATNTDKLWIGHSSSSYLTGGTLLWLGNDSDFIYHPNFLVVGSTTGINNSVTFDNAGGLRLSSGGTWCFTSGSSSAACDTSVTRLAGGVFSYTSILSPVTGFRINNTAPAGHYLRGNAANYVDATIAAADLPASITSNTSGTAAALGANGTNCAAGNFPLGVDAAGNAEGCTPASGGMANPMTTLGDIIYENATPGPARLAGQITTTKNFLTQTGNGAISAAPAWGTIQVADIPTLNQNTTGNANTASSLAANGTNCASGNYPLGVDAQGNAEGCHTIPAADVPTATWEVQLPTAGCNNASASPSWDLPTSGAAVPTCYGTNVRKAALDFANSGTPIAYYTFMLPQGLTGSADVRIQWFTATASGAATFNIDAVCTTAGSTNTDDPAWTAANFIAPAAQTASGTANALNVITVTGQAWPSGCTAGTALHLRLKRTDTGTAVTASVQMVSIVGRRTY